MTQEKFWDATVEELMQGYFWDPDDKMYTCLICNEKFESGIIYPAGDLYYEAEKAAENHVSSVHGSMADYLLGLNKKYTGLTDHQREMLVYFQEGLTDKEIANKAGVSASTIRNHRFKLREKEKQATVFLAMMGLLEKVQNQKQDFVDIHKGANMVDERFAITEKEKERVLKTYFTDDQKQLKQFPSKEKRKIIILQYIYKNFEEGTVYTEKEVNSILKNFYGDFATIRRYLIEYGFLERSKDGMKYWVK